MTGIRVYFICLYSLFFLLSGLVGCHDGGSADRKENKKTEIVVSAAMSLKAPMEEIRSLYEAERDNMKITYNFAASGVLRRQIEQGAPSDLFLSADPGQIDILVKEEIISAERACDLFHNTMVVVTRPDNSEIFSFDHLTKDDVRLVSLGDPETVPGGKYGRQLLDLLGIWENVKEKVVFARNVGQVVTYVETGNVDAGIVFKTDVLGDLEIRDTAPKGFHSNIIYTGGVIESSKDKVEAGRFLEYLQTPEAQQVFERYGFIIDGIEGRKNDGL